MNPIKRLAPKFRIGQRVRISAAGVEWNVAPEGTTGTVENCGGQAVTVRIEGRTTKPERYAPDFWDAIDETATAH